MIIDIHAHTTNSKLWDLYTESAKIADLENEAVKYGINKIILMATYFPFKNGGLPNALLMERIRGKKLFSMFGSLDAMNRFDKGIKELGEMAEKNLLSGIKLYPGYQDFSCSDEKIFPVFELAGHYRLPVALHTGELHRCCPKDERAKRKYKCKSKCQLDSLEHLSRPKEIVKAIKKFPNVNFILSHMANPYHEELREVMTEYSNAHTDISGQFNSAAPYAAEYKKEIIIEIEKFLLLEKGMERIMFATDYPIQSYKDSIDLIEALKLTTEEKEKIYFKNAIKIINIKESEL